MAMYKSQLNIGGEMKKVVVINHEMKKKTESSTVDQIHHIHILDRSGSMTGSIRQLIENVKATIRYIPDNDYVSIIWFSSAGQYKTLIKGARKDEYLNELLDTIASTLNCTCFSESLEEVGVIVNDLVTICPNFNVTLFTDGQPVVPWPESVEIHRMVSAINKWKDKVLALNTIGYGFYYNENLLKSIAAQSQFGQFIHASKINDYMDIFSHNYERVSDLCAENVSIECSFPCDILFVGSKTTKMSVGSMELSKLDKKKSQFAIIIDDHISSADFITYNGERYSLDIISNKIPNNTIEPLLYAYAYEMYYKGKRREALDIIAKNLHDKRLIDQQMSAFTFDEVSEYTKLLKSAVFKKSSRYLWGAAEDNYLPDDNAVCVMDILKTLASGNNFYVYAKEYNRIGLATIDNFNRFRGNDENAITRFDDLVFHKNKINISIRSKINGVIGLNPLQAKAVGLPNSIDSYIFRAQTIVKDGNLNMDRITILVDADTIAKLENYQKRVNKPLFFFPEGQSYKRSTLTEIVVNLSALPIINRSYLKDSQDIDSILSSTIKQTKYECQQKMLNYLIKKIKERVNVVSEELSSYTDEQIALLKEHGMDNDGSYKGIDIKTVDKDEQDYYEARTIEFQLKNHAALPTAKKVIEAMQEGGNLNGPGKIMATYLNSLMDNLHDHTLITENINTEELDNLQKELKIVKSELLNERAQTFATKIAKVLTGDWFSGLTADNKGNYTYEKGEYTLVAKLGREKCYF